MAPHLGLQRIMIPSAQVSSLTTGSITLPSARGAFEIPSFFHALAYYNVDSGTSSVTISDIPSTYKHLEIYMLGSTNRTTYSNDTVVVSFNGVSVNRSSWIGYDGNPRPYFYGSSGGYYGFSPGASANYASDAQGGGIMRINDYSSTNKGKVWNAISGFATENTAGATYGQANMLGGIWNNNSAISSITFTPSTGSQITAGSKFWIYGIKGE